MVTTNDEALAEKVGVLRNHGARPSAEERAGGPRPDLLPDFDDLGYNYRMTDIQAAIGRVQLGKMDAFIEGRRRWAQFYEQELGGLPWLEVPRTPEGLQHCWQSYVLRVDPARAPHERNALMRNLYALGINTRPGTHACHMLGLYRDRLGLSADDYPHARDCDQQSIAIPLHNRMSPDDYAYVAQAIQGL